MVGGAVRHGMNRIGHTVTSFDIKKPETSLQGALQSDIVFVCVPTPSLPDGKCDTSIVRAVVGDIAKTTYKGLVVIKSTVEPGTTESLIQEHPSLRVAFCPEFLRERAQFVDFVEYHHVCIIGTHSETDYELLKDAHGSLPKNFAKMAPMEAELSKYFWNVFNALRIVYANQFYDVCKVVGADYQKIKNAIVKHPNIPDVYLEANENFRGFAGNCLPKDTVAFAKYAAEHHTGDWNLSLFEGIVEINKIYKPTVL